MGVKRQSPGAQRAMQTFLKAKKIDLAELRRARGSRAE
jgi:hypothetical protein